MLTGGATWQINYVVGIDDVSDNDSKTVTNSKKPSKKIKASGDCHVLIWWSELQKLVVKERMACTSCGMAITNFDERTVGIATELDFSCATCKIYDTTNVLWSDYVLEPRETDNFLCRQRIDCYELANHGYATTWWVLGWWINHRTILDLTRNAFRNNWLPMKEQLGLEQVKIGTRIAAFNLKKEMMGKVTPFLFDSTTKYPCLVLDNMGWQKARKTYNFVGSGPDEQWPN
jgi:hypothetical protein